MRPFGRQGQLACARSDLENAARELRKVDDGCVALLHLHGSTAAAAAAVAK